MMIEEKVGYLVAFLTTYIMGCN